MNHAENFDATHLIYFRNYVATFAREPKTNSTTTSIDHHDHDGDRADDDSKDDEL